MSNKHVSEQLEQLERRVNREKEARHHAEKLLTEKSEALYLKLTETQQLRKNLELALWASQESFWSWRADTDIMDIRSYSLHSESILTWSGTLIALLERVHQEDIENLQFHWAMALHGKRDRIEFSFRLNIQNEFQWVRLRGRVLERGKSGEALQIVGTTKDITQQRKAEQSFHLMASAFASSREPMLVLSPNLLITECNEAFINMIGAAMKDKCLGIDFNALLSAEKVDVANLESAKQQRFESKVRMLSGEEKAVDISVALFETYLQSTSYLIATMRDISDRKANEAKLRQLALYDDLTGLSNRNALRESLAAYAEAEEPFLLVFVDLDGFKAINDNAGHESGDIELQRVAKLLKSTFGSVGEVGRWGGDEFIAVLPNIDMQEAVEKATHLIELIEEDTISASRIELKLSASIGIAQYPAHSNSIEGVIQSADAAMYQAKTQGKGCVFVYEDGLYESMAKQVTLVNSLQRAVENHLLDFYIQGKYDNTGQLKGGEVLCRWISGLHGVVSPGTFIPIAEEYNFDGQIGLQALEAACDYISIMESQQGYAIPLSINVSGNQILDTGFPAIASAICAENHVSPSMIEIELTESILIRDEDAALSALNNLRQEGFRLSLDDFGTGFSSLSYLRSFHFDVVKVDRSLIRDIHLSSKANALFNGVVTMLKSLNIEVVVEGVEIESYLPFMHQADITLMQGFYFDKPMPYEQFIARHITRAAR